MAKKVWNGEEKLVYERALQAKGCLKFTAILQTEFFYTLFKGGKDKYVRKYHFYR